MKSLTTALLALSLAASGFAGPLAKLAPTPPMGWNSWNWHGKPAINETIVRETIDAMVTSGLRDAGYVYVVVDGGWRHTKLGANGELLPHPVKFPHGMKALADYAHARGLKFGVHTVPGSHDCGGDAVGGFGREEVHVRQFVDWGLDVVKVDKCRFSGSFDGWTEDVVQTVYSKWSDLLAHCGRDIMFSISAYRYREWYPGVCNMARTTTDIRAKVTPGGAIFDEYGPPKDKSFLSVMAVTEINNEAARFAGQGYWNDPDMMVTGEQGLTSDEQKSHFALWCVMSAPLFIGSDPRQLSTLEKDILLNREGIAVNQDPTEQGRRVRTDGAGEVWVKHLSGNRIAVVLLNRDGAETRPITFRAVDAGVSGNFHARDIFERKDLGRFGGELTRTTKPHAASFLLISAEAKK